MKILYKEDLGKTRTHTKFKDDCPSLCFDDLPNNWADLEASNFTAYNMGPLWENLQPFGA